MASNNVSEGHADGIAGRAPQTRDGDLPYMVGYVSGGLERLALQIAEVKAAVAQAINVPRITPQPIPHDVAAIQANMREDA